MIRMIAIGCLAALAACSFVVPAKSRPQNTPGREKYEVMAENLENDLRTLESVQRNIQEQLAKRGAEVRMIEGDVLPMFSGAPSATRETVLEVCHTLGGVVGIEVWTWAEGASVGPQHPSVQKVKLAPGTCVFASGALVEARASGFTSVESRLATEWLTQRIAALETEPQSPARDELLKEFKSRTKNPPTSKVSFSLVTP